MCYTNKKRWERNKMLDKKLIDTSTDLIADSIDTVIAPFDFGIPVVTLIKDSIVLGRNIYDRRLLKKLLAFFDNAKYQTARNKIKMDAFFEKHISNERYAQSNGELLLEYLDQIDDCQKAALIGKVFAFCIDSGIESNDFFRVSYYISRSFYNDLMAIELFVRDEELLSSKDERLDRLYSYGFLQNCGIDSGSLDENGDSGTIYRLNQYGEIVLNALK